MTVRERLIHDERTNARLAWALVAVVAVVGVREILAGTAPWGLFEIVVALVVALPALATGDWRSIVPWPLPACAAAAGVVRAYGLVPEVAGYIVVATLAVVVAVELDVFTPVELSRRFVVLFAVLSTLAVQGLWTVAQFYSDRWFGSDLLHSQNELQWDIVAVTAVGVGMGAVFVWYFDRFGPAGSERPLTPQGPE